MAIGEFEPVVPLGPLARASRALRERPEPGWDALEERVIAAVRDTPRGGWPLMVVDPDPGRVPGRIAVTDRALKAHLAQVLRDDPDHAVGAIDVYADESTLRQVRIELTGRYDVDLRTVAQRALRQCQQALDDVIGAASTIPIEVVVTDVHR